MSKCLINFFQFFKKRERWCCEKLEQKVAGFSQTESQRWCLKHKSHCNSRFVLWCRGEIRLPILQAVSRWYFKKWFKQLPYFSVLLSWGVHRFSDPSLLSEAPTGDVVSARPCLLWCSAIKASSCFLLCRSSSLNISCLRISDHNCYFKN